MWAQHEVKLPAFKRGCHLITDTVTQAIAASLRGVSIGLVHVFSECAGGSCKRARRADTRSAPAGDSLRGPRLSSLTAAGAARQPRRWSAAASCWLEQPPLAPVAPQPSTLAAR